MIPEIPIRFTLLTVYFFFTAALLHAQPAVQWAKCYGSTSADLAFGLVNAWGDGYVFGGDTDSGSKGGQDFWITKLDDSGNVDWQKYYGGSGAERAFFVGKVKSETDSGYLMVGNTFSNNGDVTGFHGAVDIWVIKTDVNGNLLWQKALGGPSIEYGWAARGTPDGGCVVIGEVSANGGDVTGHHGNQDMWVVRLDSMGSIMWQKCLGGTGYDDGRAIALTHDGGFVAAGRATVADGDVSNIIGGHDYWIVKLSSTGALVWEKNFGGYGSDFAFSIEPVRDSGFIIAGWSTYNPANNGLYESVLKIDKNGAQQWTAQPALTYDAIQTKDNGFVTLSVELGNYNVTKLTSTGIIGWSRNVGGTGTDQPWAIIMADDGGYVIGGWTNSHDGAVTGNHGAEDAWIVKLTPDPLSTTDINYNYSPISIYPNPATDEIEFSEKVNVKLINLTGQVIANQQNVKTLNIAQYQPGLYFVVFYDEKGQIMQRGNLIKE